MERSSETLDPIASTIRPLDPKLAERLAQMLVTPTSPTAGTTFRSLGEILQDMAGGN